MNTNFSSENKLKTHIDKDDLSKKGIKWVKKQSRESNVWQNVNQIRGW